MTDRPTCCIEGCNRDVRCREMCYPHYLRARRGATPEQMIAPLKSKGAPVRRCELDGCGEEHYAVGLCRWHYKAEWIGRDPLKLQRRRPTGDQAAGQPPPAA